MNYEDLAFKPAMTWDELKEEARKIYKGNIIEHSEVIGIPLEQSSMYFRKNGCIDVEFAIGNNNVGGLDIKTKATYEQMKNIIDNLYGE